ncbi:hypothetical protein R1flu_011435 [Riccia fluitans]|uniref:2-phosphoglycerate kinase n=1 Tax=Riccia fluitans TaxID=41844 RepID=A0ABD1Z8X3_9MARC
MAVAIQPRLIGSARFAPGDDEEAGSGSPPLQPVTRPPRHTSSKYDFVKVRVWLGDNSDHYYVLSRFLVSRMLTVTKIPNHVAIKISLELKKLLIDNSLLDVSQSDLEANLFKLMERRGYGGEYIDRYKMMTRFHHQRVPLIILVCGTPCVGKSTIATQLAQRLNLPNVLQTDMVYELLRTSTDAPLVSTPIWAREFSSTDGLLTEFCRECRIVRKGLDGDLRKAMKDGKSVIIEGLHLDPSIYLMNEESGALSQKEASGPSHEPPTHESEPSSAPVAEVSSKDEATNSGTVQESSNVEFPRQKEVAGHTEKVSHSLLAMSLRAHSRESGELTGDASTSAGGTLDQVPEKPSSSIEVSSGGKARSESEERRKEPLAPVGEPSSGGSSGSKLTSGRSEDLGRKPPAKPLAKAIVVPIVLRMAEIDHQTLLEEWIACRSMDGTGSLEEKEALVSKLRTLQDYLCSFEAQGVKVVDISATTFPQTLDSLHSYLLQCIERECSPATPTAASTASS